MWTCYRVDSYYNVSPLEVSRTHYDTEDAAMEAASQISLSTNKVVRVVRIDMTEIWSNVQ